jgi:hypothetical protein
VGDLTVPADVPVRLVVDLDAARDLSWLDACAPDDFAQLYLVQTNVTDDGLEHVGRLAGLEVLSLAHTAIGDAGVAHLHGLAKLRRLYLNATEVTDAGLAYVKTLTRLETISLGATRITDAGVAHLFGLSNLKKISFDDSYAGARARRSSRLTAEGMAALHRALPRCTVS